MAIELADILRQFGLPTWSSSPIACRLHTAGSSRLSSDAGPRRTAAICTSASSAARRCMYTTPAATGTARPVTGTRSRRGSNNAPPNCCRVTYFHVTVTIPDPLRLVFRRHQDAMYAMLMKTAAESLIQLADDPQHLGGRGRPPGGAAYLGQQSPISPPRPSAGHRGRHQCEEPVGSPARRSIWFPSKPCPG